MQRQKAHLDLTGRSRGYCHRFPSAMLYDARILRRIVMHPRVSSLSLSLGSNGSFPYPHHLNFKREWVETYRMALLLLLTGLRPKRIATTLMVTISAGYFAEKPSKGFISCLVHHSHHTLLYFSCPSQSQWWGHCPWAMAVLHLGNPLLHTQT